MCCYERDKNDLWVVILTDTGAALFSDTTRLNIFISLSCEDDYGALILFQTTTCMVRGIHVTDTYGVNSRSTNCNLRLVTNIFTL